MPAEDRRARALLLAATLLRMEGRHLAEEEGKTKQDAMALHEELLRIAEELEERADDGGP